MATKKKTAATSRKKGAAPRRRAATTSSTPSTPTTPTTPTSYATLATPTTPVSSVTPVTPITALWVSPSPVVSLTATGDHILAKAREHIGEKYVLGARAPLGNQGWKGPWDCAELASWCLYQATEIIYGARPRNHPMRADPYTGFWAEDAEASHQLHGNVIVPVETAARTPGAFVLRKPGVYRKVGHIVVSDGNGGTVEAMSRSRGVVEGSLDRRWWDYGILVPGVQYFMGETPVELTPPHRLLRVTNPLMRGAMIEAVQRALAAKGFDPGAIDGIYGGQTLDAVSRFQDANGLVVDGEVGDETLDALGMEWNA